jgi:hypothetical protein
MSFSAKILFLILLFQVTGRSQAPYILRGDQTYHTLDRMEMLRFADTTMVTSIGNYNRDQVISYLRNVSDSALLSKRDMYDISHILAENTEFLFGKGGTDTIAAKNFMTGALRLETYERNPVWKYFYHTRAHFLEHSSSHFRLFINPVVQVSYLDQKNNPATVFQNTRGIDVRAYIDKKVYVYTRLTENQQSFPDYADRRIRKFGAIPGNGSWQPYTSNVIPSLEGYDFFNVRAYVGFNPVKSINVEFGHGNHFIGNGVRSLLLSDLSHNYLYLKFNTRMWKFQYQNIFGELSPISEFVASGDVLLPKKYAAMHYLAFRPSQAFEVGVYEAVIFSRPDHFEFQYLNPVIFYRAVEQHLNSPDNVLLGLNMKWQPIRKVSLYGQLLLDEFNLGEIRKQSGWWANKVGWQAGIKYVNVFGIDHLDLQVEINTVRPYTYSHQDSLSKLLPQSVGSYSHYNQPLAHPLGANFLERLLIVRYKPCNRWHIQTTILNAEYGEDRPGENWGGNILLPHQTRQQGYGNKTGQGERNNVLAINTDISYEFYHNYFADLHLMWRRTTSSEVMNQHYIGSSVRVNINSNRLDY